MLRQKKDGHPDYESLHFSLAGLIYTVNNPDKISAKFFFFCRKDNSISTSILQKKKTIFQKLILEVFRDK